MLQFIAVRGFFDVCKQNVYFSCKCPHTKLQQSNHETENKKQTTLSQSDQMDSHIISYISDVQTFHSTIGMQ
jgi:uncharacterized protein YpmS